MLLFCRYSCTACAGIVSEVASQPFVLGVMLSPLQVLSLYNFLEGHQAPQNIPYGMFANSHQEPADVQRRGPLGSAHLHPCGGTVCCVTGPGHGSAAWLHSTPPVYDFCSILMLLHLYRAPR